MKNKMSWLARVSAIVVLGTGLAGNAQTLATGDSRTVTEPVFPASCAVLAAQQAIVSAGPASETAFDTSRIQTALTACPNGQAVELTASGTNNAFLIQPLTVPSGVGLIVDGGVTVFASRNPSDYQTASTELCGGHGPNGGGCKQLLTFAKGSGSGVYGYGVIDARGGSTMLGGPNPGMVWWTNSDNAGIAGETQDNPEIMYPSSVNNFTLYKITLRNSPINHVSWYGNGLTVWGIKIATPFTAHNTDGIDVKGTNITVNRASISDGDDNLAAGASVPSSNITVENSNTYSGHGISIGSYTQDGLSNMLVNNVNMAGTAADGNATGIRLKSAEDRGNVVQTITYENMCLRDVRHALVLDPFYDANTGTEIPTFQNVVLSNIHYLTPTATTFPYLVELQGFDANHLSTITLDNVVFDQLVQKYVTPAPQDTTITLMGNVYPAFLQTLTGPGVSYNGTATATAAAGVSACTNVFPYIVGELYGSTAMATNLKSTTIGSTATVTLNAMVEPAMSQTSFSGTVGTWTGVAAPTAAVNFYEGTTLVGTVTLGGNGTLASLTLSGLNAGTHTYTAAYPGDSNYQTISFGSVVVTVNGTATTTVLTALASAVYGVGQTLSATVNSSNGGTPTGSVKFLDGTTLLGTGTLTNGSTSITGVILTGGTHSIAAMYSGDSQFLASTSTASTVTITTAASTTSLSISPTTTTALAPVNMTATVSGVPLGTTPTGKVTFADGSTALGTGMLSGNSATLTASLPTSGSRTITATYAGDTNYAGSSGTAIETVTQIATTTVVSLMPTATYNGGTLTITATVSPATYGTVTFYNGGASIGTGTVSGAGVATLSYTVPTSATANLSISASYTSGTNGGYANSTSAAVTLMLSAAVLLSSSASSINVVHGSSGTVTLTLLPVAGYTGAVAMGCSTAVKYVTCAVNPMNATVAGANATTVTGTISVAATLSKMMPPTPTEQHHSGTMVALLGPLGVLAMTITRRRKAIGKLVLLMLLAWAGAAIMSGCGSGVASSIGPSNIPSGSQPVTFLATANGVTQSVVVTVNIQ